MLPICTNYLSHCAEVDQLCLWLSFQMVPALLVMEQVVPSFSCPLTLGTTFTLNLLHLRNAK